MIDNFLTGDITNNNTSLQTYKSHLINFWLLILLYCLYTIKTQRIRLNSFTCNKYRCNYVNVKIKSK